MNSTRTTFLSSDFNEKLMNVQKVQTDADVRLGATV